jgi:acetyl-CoA decarbonylase/synthase complex subunit gamma
VNGSVDTPVGPIPAVSGHWSWRDRWGTVKARLSIGRMDYDVVPGLYALNSPNAASPVLVTANYKMSFDRLRRAAAGLDAWILALDTDGINVWCAAGKGTFGTDELARRLADTRLDIVITHRRLILPQLGAPGVAGHLVERRTGFDVVWGPVMAEDLPVFLAAGCVATPEMRRRLFPLRERAALIPVDLIGAGKWLLPAMALALLLGGIVHRGGFLAGVLDHGFTGALALLGATVAGVIATTLLLPLLPFRAFAAKGALVGLALTVAVLVWRGGGHFSALLTLEAAGWLLMATALSAFLAMNFTGSSTFTSLSGVRREMRVAVPAEIVGAVAGLGLWLSSLWLAGGGG